MHSFLRLHHQAFPVATAAATGAPAAALNSMPDEFRRFFSLSDSVWAAVARTPSFLPPSSPAGASPSDITVPAGPGWYSGDLSCLAVSMHRRISRRICVCVWQHWTGSLESATGRQRQRRRRTWWRWRCFGGWLVEAPKWRRRRQINSSSSPSSFRSTVICVNTLCLVRATRRVPTARSTAVRTCYYNRAVGHLNQVPPDVVVLKISPQLSEHPVAFCCGLRQTTHERIKYRQSEGTQ